MANSEFLFKGNARNLKDSVIGRFLDELEMIVIGSELEWLETACVSWQKDWKSMPPGCKDIDLDEVITDDSRKVVFRKKLQEIQAKVEDGIGDELGRVIELVE